MEAKELLENLDLSADGVVNSLGFPFASSAPSWVGGSQPTGTTEEQITTHCGAYRSSSLFFLAPGGQKSGLEVLTGQRSLQSL